MTDIPDPINHTVEAIYKALAKSARSGDNPTISLSDAANSCDRAIWNTFRWISHPQAATGQRQSSLNTHNIWEERLIFDLRSIWCEVLEEQASFELVDGHVKGKILAIVTGVPEAPKTEHVVIAKPHNLKSFKALTKLKLEVGNPSHYARCQLAMHAANIDRCLYLAVCKDDDARYAERVKYDPVYCIRLEAKLHAIVQANVPPPRVETFACDWCKSKNQCLDGAWSRVHCRTCLYSEPGVAGLWHCYKHGRDINHEEQQAGCQDHRYIPDLVFGEQIDVTDGDLIYYKMNDGTMWIDGMREGV